MPSKSEQVALSQEERVHTSHEVAFFKLLGAQVHAVEMADLNNAIASSIYRGQRHVIANHNLHSLRLYQKDERMREFYAHAEIVHIDGMSLVILGKLLGLPLRRQHRTAYIDWTPALMSRAAEEGWKVFYLGSEPGVAERGASLLREQWSGLQIATHHGFFDTSVNSDENARVLDTIADYAPNVVMVGMGMPRQERWILENLQRIHANAILNAGACVNFVAGSVPTPPRWMGRVGLEWSYRLFTEPRRLWHRYLVEPWVLVPLIAREMVMSIPSRFQRTAA